MIILEEKNSANNISPDLTPMLDILFILLFFLMLSSGIIFKSLNVDLPKSSNKNLKQIDNPNHLVLEIHPDFYLINQQKADNFVSLKRIIDDISFSNSNKDFVIAGDKNVSLERFLEILTYLQTKNIQTANILINEKND